MPTVLFQFFFLLFSLLIIAGMFRKQRDGILSVRAWMCWMLFWLAADAAVLFPDTMTRIANRFGIGRGADFVLYISIAIMFFLLLQLHLKIEGMQRDVTKVVRKEALEKK